MLTLEQYKQDQARIIAEAAAAEQARKDQAAAVQSIEWKYSQLERDLRNEKNAAIAAATKPAATIDYTTAHEYRELLELYPLLNAPAPEPAGRVYFHESWRLTAGRELGTPDASGGYPVRVLSPVRLITAGSALNISYYIAGNKKPTNCFTVIIAGNSIFNLQANDGGVSVSTDNTNIRRALRDFSTLDAARAWIERAPDPAICREVAELSGRLEELRAVDGPEWRAAWVEYRLAWYRLEYSHYEEQPEYIALLLEQIGGE